jgi:hypothetical protein
VCTVNAEACPAAPDPAHDHAPLDSKVPFALFEGDGLHFVYSRLGLSNYARFHLFKRCLLVVMLTWVPLAVLALRQGLVGGGISPTNFFADFAAYAQFLLAMPLFVLAEPIIDLSTRQAAKQFVACGIIKPEDGSKIYSVHATIQRARQSRWSDLACVLMAYGYSLAILVPIFHSHPMPEWHAQGDGQARVLTAAGIWEFAVALPLLNYTWLRFVWKILLWIFYLYRVSRLHLDLHPTHPDLTGGIGFVSEAQGRFAIFILAYGISNIAATVGYEIAILHYDFSVISVWSPIVGFAIGAPLLFTLPLCMFTKQLFRSKRRALAAYRQRVTEHSRRLEGRWLMGAGDAQSTQATEEEMRELAEFTTLGTMFSRIEQMRVVPLDLQSLGQLVGSTFGSIATLLPLLHANGALASIFEAIGKLLGHAGGG